MINYVDFNDKISLFTKTLLLIVVSGVIKLDKIQ